MPKSRHIVIARPSSGNPRVATSGSQDMSQRTVKLSDAIGLVMTEVDGWQSLLKIKAVKELHGKGYRASRVPRLAWV